MAAAAENRAGRGRPGRLTAELEAAIVAKLSAGAGLDEAARACGVGPRTLRTWRRRAWSREPADAPFIRLEKGIQRALASRAPVEPQSWEQLAARLELEFPDRWRLDLDDFFDGAA